MKKKLNCDTIHDLHTKCLDLKNTDEWNYLIDFDAHFHIIASQKHLFLCLIFFPWLPAMRRWIGWYKHHIFMGKKAVKIVDDKLKKHKFLLVTPMTVTAFFSFLIWSSCVRKNIIYNDKVIGVLYFVQWCFREIRCTQLTASIARVKWETWRLFFLPVCFLSVEMPFHLSTTSVSLVTVKA